MEDQQFTTLYIRNLPHGTRREMLIEIFSNFGTVKSARVIERPCKNLPWYGFVDLDFDAASRASKAIITLQNRQLYIYFARTQPSIHSEALQEYRDMKRTYFDALKKRLRDGEHHRLSEPNPNYGLMELRRKYHQSRGRYVHLIREADLEEQESQEVGRTPVTSSVSSNRSTAPTRPADQPGKRRNR